MIITERYLEREPMKLIKIYKETLKFFIEFLALFVMLESRNRKSFYGKMITHQ